MIRLILFSLFLTAVNCQLAYVYLNYHHFQCSQNTRNYRESIRHQYRCTYTLTWTCRSDVNVYSHNSELFLDYFWGFIDGQNALQPQTIWNIHLKPNVNIHFLNFFLLDNYWYCDYEYLKVYSNNKTTTFCGIRFPWVHDASDTKVKIILMTQRFGTKNYQLELLYYGAYVPNYQHYIIFLPSSPVMNIHYPNTEQNAFESFHFISRNRLDIMELQAMNACSKSQVVCHDGPGFKSPVLQFTYNQSVWKCLSSTFQMMCKFSRVADVCTNGPRLYYRAIRARDHQVDNVHLNKFCGLFRGELKINEAHRNDTSKYIYYFPDTAIPRGCILRIKRMHVSFPYMLIEGSSCMYGGVYIVQSNSCKDSEILSVCNSADGANLQMTDLNNVSIVIIHYSEYSTERITFHAIYTQNLIFEHLDLNQKYKGETVSITVPKISNGFIQSHQLKLRQIHYVNIRFDASLHIHFIGFLRASCMNATIYYSPHPSNIRGRQYDQETISGRGTFGRKDFVHSIVINMCACNLLTVRVWQIIKLAQGGDNKFGIKVLQKEANTTRSYTLPADVVPVHVVWHPSSANINKLRPFWFMVHMLKPEDVPVYAIWRVFTNPGHMTQVTSHVSIEVLTDKHHSSSVYEWHHFRSPVYITVDKAVNILIESRVSVDEQDASIYPMHIWFMRHFIHDDKINKYITGQAPQQSHFSFHNQR